MADIASFILGVISGIIIPIISDIIKEEYKSYRIRTNRMKEFRDEAKAVINSIIGTWNMLGRKKVANINIEKEIIEYTKDLNDYLSHYLVYGGKRKVVQEINSCISEILQLLQGNEKAIYKIEEYMEKLKTLSGML